MSTYRSHITPFTTTVVALALAILSGGSALAQRFEQLVSNAASNERGWYGVAPCRVNTGYIAVGETDAANSCANVNKDVLVTFFKLNGNVMGGWPKTYDLGGACGTDIGTCVIECANGEFAICGTTTTTGTCGSTTVLNSFIMRIKANGNVLWTRIYPKCTAERLVETTLGNPQFGTSAGDLVFCGRTAQGRALIARVKGGNGALIWNQTYQTATLPGGEFFDVIEATNAFGAPGDIVATGILDTLATIVRVNGNSGRIGLAPQGVAQYGSGFGTVKLHSVQELQVGLHAGELVATGYTGDIHIYVVRTKTNPCSFLVDAKHSINTNDWPYSIREINPPATSSMNPGHLALTGYTTASTAGSVDMFLLELKPAGLTVGGLGFHVYDAAGAGQNDVGHSLNPVYDQGTGTEPSDGFILCGESDQSASGLGIEQYIVKTDINGNEDTPCDDGTQSVTSTTPNLTTTCPAVTLVRPLVDCALASTTPVTTTWVVNCYIFPKQSTPGDPLPSIDEALTLAPTPNPVRAGNDLELAIGVRESAPVTLVISDVTGKTVATITRQLGAGHSAITLGTDGWPTGTYMVTANVGETSKSVRVVVVE